MNNAWITISTVSSVFLWNELVVPTDRWPIMIFSKICFACAANLTRKATEAPNISGEPLVCGRCAAMPHCHDKRGTYANLLQFMEYCYCRLAEGTHSHTHLLILFISPGT